MIGNETSLARAIAAFEGRFGFFKDPAACMGTCNYASSIFRSMLPQARCIHFWGAMRPFPNKLDRSYACPDRGLYHVAVLYRGQVIDWTRRQFEPRAAFPFILPFGEAIKEWRFWAPRHHFLPCFRDWNCGEKVTL